MSKPVVINPRSLTLDNQCGCVDKCVKLRFMEADLDSFQLKPREHYSGLKTVKYRLNSSNTMPGKGPLDGECMHHSVVRGIVSTRVRRIRIYFLTGPRKTNKGNDLSTWIRKAKVVRLTWELRNRNYEKEPGRPHNTRNTSG